MNTQPAWLDKKLFPFESKWIEIDGRQMHYIDEGKGPVILFVHGTPEWCFGYRDMVRELRSSFRCIAFDMLGFGLSDHHPEIDYRVEAHNKRLTAFIDALQLNDVTIVANDFGGSISVPYAIDHSDRVKRLVLFNTWMWSLKNDKHYSGPATVMNSWLGKILYQQFNFPVNVIMPAAFGNKKLLTPRVHAHYKHALPIGKRSAAYVFAQELMNASGWWESYWRRLNTLQQKPVLLLWGMKDKFVPPRELEQWKSKFPNAKVVAYNDAGHFVQEEKSYEMVQEIRNFMTL